MDCFYYLMARKAFYLWVKPDLRWSARPQSFDSKAELRMLMLAPSQLRCDQRSNKANVQNLDALQQSYYVAE